MKPVAFEATDFCHVFLAYFNLHLFIMNFTT
jgi:hypothetical protein